VIQALNLFLEKRFGKRYYGTSLYGKRQKARGRLTGNGNETSAYGCSLVKGIKPPLNQRFGGSPPKWREFLLLPIGLPSALYPLPPAFFDALSSLLKIVMTMI